MTNDNGPATHRLVSALGDPDRLFDSGQVAYLMSTAMRWGYENAEAELAADPLSWRAGLDQGYRRRVAEENGGYPPPPYLIADGIRVREVQAGARAAAGSDRARRYAGGPVADWGPSLPEPERDPRPMRVRRVGASWVWADA